MNIISARNPAWVDDQQTKIQLLVVFDEIGTETPFTTSASATTTYGQILFAKALAGEYGPVAPYAPDLSALKASKRGRLTAAYFDAMQTPVTYNGNPYQTDLSSQATLSKTITALLYTAAVPVGFYWVDANNAKQPLTFAGLQGLALAMFTAGWAAFQHLQAKKLEVDTATTQADIEGVVW